MWFGTEFRLFVFEALFFCTIDMELTNIPLSALLTFLVIIVIKCVVP